MVKKCSAGWPFDRQMKGMRSSVLGRPKALGELKIDSGARLILDLSMFAPSTALHCTSPNTTLHCTALVKVAAPRNRPIFLPLCSLRILSKHNKNNIVLF
jgi:hypothetical protein